jgi:hypothetical protein
VSKALEKVATERGLQLHQNWLNKCIQLYETYLVSVGCDRWCSIQACHTWRVSVALLQH